MLFSESCDNVVQLLELGSCICVNIDIRFLASSLAKSGPGTNGMVHTSMNVSAVLNWPVLRKCSAIVRSRAALASGEENKGEYVGRGVWNFCETY